MGGAHACALRSTVFRAILMVGAYLRAWLARSLRAALLSAGFESRAKTMAIVVQWAASVLILYQVDWRRIPLIGTDDPQASSEVCLGLAVVGAILLVFGLNFLWQLVRQPAAMDAELRQEMARQARAADERDGQRQAEIDRLRAAIDRARDAEDLLKRLSDLYEEGRLRAWDTEVGTIIENNFSVSVMHQYRKGVSYGMWQTKWNAPDGDERLKYRYTSLLMGLDDIIKLGAPLRTAQLKLLQ